MTESPELHSERLSAFVDAELSSSEQDSLSRQLATDIALRRQLGRYQRISSALRQEHENRVDAGGIADAVSRALRDEPTVLAPRRRPANLSRIALGAALAATVAAVAVGVAPQLLETDLPVDAQAPTFAFAPRLSVPAFPATTVALGDTATVANRPDSERWKVLKPDLQRKLDAYLLEHSEFAGRLGVAPANAHVGFISIHDK